MAIPRKWWGNGKYQGAAFTDMIAEIKWEVRVVIIVRDFAPQKSLF